MKRIKSDPQTLGVDISDPEEIIRGSIEAEKGDVDLFGLEHLRRPTSDLAPGGRGTVIPAQTPFRLDSIWL